MFYCTAQATVNPGTGEACAWMNKPYNFDNIGAAVMAMFTAARLTGPPPNSGHQDSRVNCVPNTFQPSGQAILY